jgi:hypothetical protein
MAKPKAQEEDGSSENGQLDTGEFEKPENSANTLRTKQADFIRAAVSVKPAVRSRGC